MNKMQKEFNDAVATGAILPDFFCVTSGYSSSIKWLGEDWDGEKYKNDKLQSAWSIWKASRQSMCVDLPDIEWLDNHTVFMSVEVTDALDEAGVSFK